MTDAAVRLASKAAQDLGESNNPDIQLKLTEMTDPAKEADSGVRAEAAAEVVSFT